MKKNLTAKMIFFQFGAQFPLKKDYESKVVKT